MPATAATREDGLRLTKLRFDNGASSELDFRQAESLLEGARVTLAQALRQKALDENALQLLVGQTLLADLPGPLPLDQAQLEARVARSRACSRVARSRSRHGAATPSRSSMRPRPREPRRRRRQPRHRGGAVREVDPDHVPQGLRRARRRRDARRAAARSLAQTDALAVAFQLADLRYRVGAASYLNALDTQRSLLTARQALEQARELQLQDLVGGGWREASEVNATPSPASRSKVILLTIS